MDFKLWELFPTCFLVPQLGLHGRDPELVEHLPWYGHCKIVRVALRLTVISCSSKLDQWHGYRSQPRVECEPAMLAAWQGLDGTAVGHNVGRFPGIPTVDLNPQVDKGTANRCCRVPLADMTATRSGQQSFGLWPFVGPIHKAELILCWKLRQVDSQT